VNSSVKLILDIVLGAVVPILILNNFSSEDVEQNILVYVVAAMIPVLWVVIDLIFITKRFNFITSYVGLNAIKDGLLVFWFVDGWLYALKDTSSIVLSFIIFGGSLLLGKPILKFFLFQALNPDTPQRERALKELLSIKSVRQSLILGTAIVMFENLISGVANFVLNLNIVEAEFGTGAFNEQVASVNSITRIAFPIGSFIAFGVAFYFIFNAIYRNLPQVEGKSQWDVEFWELVEQKQSKATQE
jgi:hypothetical protein